MSETINLARYKKGADTFEVVVNPDKAVDCKRNPEKDIRDALVYPQVYSDAKKGLLAPEDSLQKTFGTTDHVEIAKKIICDGNIQVTSEYRQQQVEQKRKRIIDLIHRQGVDPRTNSPHPLTRIENALSEAKVRIDESDPAEAQVPSIIKALRPILPIRLVTKELRIKIPAQHAPRAFPTLKLFGKILNENWGADGSWNDLCTRKVHSKMRRCYACCSSICSTRTLANGRRCLTTNGNGTVDNHIPVVCGRFHPLVFRKEIQVESMQHVPIRHLFSFLFTTQSL